MDADVLLADTDTDGRLDPVALRALVEGLEADDRARIAAVIATSGSTNAGLIDPLEPVADLADELGVWFHVDGAYGAAALAAPSLRARFAGIERADSFIVDPHKWLFAPFDCCALVYREPLQARRAHTQHAEYLDALHDAHQPDWNPSDFAHHLSRRARGLPFWFSLATYGTRAYGDAVETSVRVAHEGAELIRSASHLHLVSEPELSVLLFRRTGFAPADYDEWSARMLADGEAFVVPTTWKGETVLRLCLVNPRTTLDDLRLIFDSLA
jgi:glutamate/tyrosine decarboxylase-like PLP-dependent enzyme